MIPAFGGEEGCIREIDNEQKNHLAHPPQVSAGEEMQMATTNG